ncbi:uncharacterized protein LOC122513498 [Polistes fuscatus]|uniref:uncharacterized protein LOC122513498 n=1 Tax=Polistes fuscatus TaxID=30207 RepID=UPI001CAA1BE0|nr:uncharacterized protein LOC122513498 [Polistes fuscatus]
MKSKKQLGREQRILKMRLTCLEKVIEVGKLSTEDLINRYELLTKQLDKYKLLCADGDSEEEEFNELKQILNRYYAIGKRIDASKMSAVNTTSKMAAVNITSNMAAVNTTIKTSADNSVNTNTTSEASVNTNTIIKKRSIEIPKFDGDIDKWLSFKNCFLTYIDARTDLSDLCKLIYLRDSLVGMPLSVLQTYPLTGENYKISWAYLLERFDVQSVHLARALDALIDIPRLETTSIEDITQFVNNLRARVRTVNFFNKPYALQVRLAERALPHAILQEWIKRIDLYDYPTIEKLCDFLTEFEYRSSAFTDFSSSTRTERSAKRKQPDRRSPSPRKRQNTYNASRFFTNVSPKCIICKELNHALYRCSKYNRMTKSDRWEVIENHKLCSNCLRKHQGLCRSSRCKICNKLHHTSLHRNNDI